eukprot:CAMPEP_0183710594 /NCGR_PEP_ID=MMETSP0737-20130205/6301_1 /TAXON_ID=385413 /ORGANISM="Thalassiosira miniscula, Strain CCMP1093" /LENGTH=283 /DNA_ID=CAMNT_0025938903 /DNA_START=93 /DNA_END=944 /DNA_ORIENTATION=+
MATKKDSIPIFSRPSGLDSTPYAMDKNSDIDAWRRVHRQLTLAVIQSRDNIAAELTKRRYILEEMNRCKMQSTQKSAVNSSSSSSNKAKKKTVPKKVAPAIKKEKSLVIAGKVKKPSPSVLADAKKSLPLKEKPSKTKIPPKVEVKPKVPIKLAGHKNYGVVTESAPTSSSKIAPSIVKKVGGDSDGPSETKIEPLKPSKKDDSDGNEVLHPNPQQFGGIIPQQLSHMYYPPNPYGMYGTMGMGTATAQQMELALQMMQHMNQSAVAEEEEDDDDAGDGTIMM